MLSTVKRTPSPQQQQAVIDFVASKAAIFKSAHEIARREMRIDAAFYDNVHARAFGDALRAVYAEIRYAADCDCKYGKDMRPGFQIVEPAHWQGFAHK